MSGLSMTDIFLLIALLAPLSLLVVGFILLYAYAAYVIISRRVSRFFSHTPLKQRKAQ